MKHLRVLSLAACTVLGAAPAVFAHALGQGYLFIDVSDNALSGRTEFTLTDLDIALGLDDDGDGKVSDAEVEAHLPRIQEYVTSRVRIGTEESWYEIRFARHEIESIPIGQFLWLYFETDVQSVPDVLTFEYEALFDEDPLHRGFLVIERNEKTGVLNTTEAVTLVFSPDLGPQSVDVTRISAWTSFTEFVKHGVWHIWIGFDHILFILALILPSVMRRQGDEWRPASAFPQAFWNVVKIVTLFTVAHTVTLTLASLDVVRLPSRLVEAVIAASVVFAALNNVFPIARDRIGWVVFGFGLFHGFGFASVLQHLVSGASNVAIDLFGFNLGVEIGQIAIVAVVFPICFAIRASPAYRRGLLPVGSAAIALFALGWLVERVADLEFMPL